MNYCMACNREIVGKPQAVLCASCAQKVKRAQKRYYKANKVVGRRVAEIGNMYKVLGT